MRPEALIMKDVVLDIESGTMMAIVGSSGSGKSSFVSLLLRFYDPCSGSIKIDGIDITVLDPHWLRQQIGTVSQEPALFSCSIRDNILYGAIKPEDMTDERVEEVAKEANAFEFISKFPKGLDTLVGERGIMLSGTNWVVELNWLHYVILILLGGQKQRIAIARALIKVCKYRKRTSL